MAMAAVVPAVLAGSAIAGGALSAASNIMAGKEANAAQQWQANQLEQQGKQIKTAAAQAEAVRRDDLTSSLETIMAIRAGRGVGESSPTAMALYGNLVNQEEKNVRTERLNYLTQADTTRQQAILSRRKGTSSLLGGYLSAGADIAGAAYKVAGAYK